MGPVQAGPHDCISLATYGFTWCQPMFARRTDGHGHASTRCFRRKVGTDAAFGTRPAPAKAFTLLRPVLPRRLQ